jgi:hypothetical protein
MVTICIEDHIQLRDKLTNSMELRTTDEDTNYVAT